MKDKLTKKKERFDYYQFLLDKGLFAEYCEWKKLFVSKVSEKKLRHNFVVSKGLWHELKHSKYDAKFVEIVRIAKTPWLTD